MGHNACQLLQPQYYGFMKQHTKQRLLTPGPSPVPSEVLQEMAQPIIHHRTKQFRAIFGELSRLLQKIFCTDGPVLSITGSGTTAFEATQVSLAEPGTKVITVANGKFGERWQDIYDQYQFEQVRIELPWGQVPSAAQIQATLEEHPDASVVTVVHSETSTATACDIQAIAEVVRHTDALLVVDGITSVGAIPIDMDDWGIDVVVSGSQKALMLPPGLGYVALGPRAVERLSQFKPVHTYNLDIRRWLTPWYAQDVPFTPPVSLIRGQRVALEMIQHAGLRNTHQKTAQLAAATRAALTAWGLKLVSKSPSDSVSGAFYPQGIEDRPFRSILRDVHGIHIAGGQDGRMAEWSGEIFRLSHMGYVNADDTLVALNAIEKELIERGCAIEKGSAQAVAGKHLNNLDR
tara:strand:- start:695 stop:1909 length:1215 start_codon:yes stop_codon:yes gene_type:complete